MAKYEINTKYYYLEVIAVNNDYEDDDCNECVLLQSKCFKTIDEVLECVDFVELSQSMLDSFHIKMNVMTCQFDENQFQCETDFINTYTNLLKEKVDILVDNIKSISNKYAFTKRMCNTSIMISMSNILLSGIDNTFYIDGNNISEVLESLFDYIDNFKDNYGADYASFFGTENFSPKQLNIIKKDAEEEKKILDNLKDGLTKIYKNNKEEKNG